MRQYACLIIKLFFFWFNRFVLVSRKFLYAGSLSRSSNLKNPVGSEIQLVVCDQAHFGLQLQVYNKLAQQYSKTVLKYLISSVYGWNHLQGFYDHLYLFHF